MALAITLPEFERVKVLRASSGTTLFEAVRTSDQARVLLKSYVPTAVDPVAAAHQEAEALRTAGGPGVPRLLDLVETAEGPVLVLGSVPGRALSSWVRSRLPSVREFLDVALHVTEILARIHAARLVHLGISPETILVESEQLSAHIVSFEHSHRVGVAGGHLDISHLPEAAASYIAPEQTGRMGRGVDSRSDLYSLGATLYFAATGIPPFEEDDLLELIHAHMARAPTSPLERRSDLPPILSRIILKLLHKSPESRYQTARALARDLLECREQLERSGAIEDDFSLGSADAPYRPLFSQELLGREEQLSALAEAYSSARHRTRTLLLPGAPGIGKTALVNALRPLIAKGNGYLAQGKFDVYRRDLPYSALFEAFDSLLQQILTESEDRLAVWSNHLKRALGVSAGVLVEFLPDLALVVGEVSPPPILGPAETRARLSLAVQRLVQGTARAEHPLVLFLDDLQWADAGSRELLRDLLLEHRTLSFLVLGSYRDTEVTSEHALMSLIDELKGQGVCIDTIALSPLSLRECTVMLADALGRSPADTSSLASTVLRKTGGIPLLIQQFALHMYDRNLIWFDPEIAWTWNDEAIQAADIPDGAAGLFTAKIERLGANAAEALKLASCIGDAFDLDTLDQLTNRERLDLQEGLFELSDEGLIAPAREGFRFAHDRIREAARSLLSADERSRIHYEAARLLLDNASPAEIDRRAFEIADHLNASLDRSIESDRVRFLERNLAAGAKALGAGAAVTALHYLVAAREQISELDWAEQPRMALEISLRAGEAAFQSQSFDLVLEIVDSIEAKKTAALSAAQAAAMRIRVHAVLHGQEATLPLVLRTLRKFGVRWPERPSLIRLWVAMWRTDRVLKGPLDDSQFRWVKGDTSFLAPIYITGAGGASFSVRSFRNVLVVSGFGVRCFERYGIAGSPGLALAVYAGHRHYFMRDIRKVERIAKAALEWGDRLPHPINGHRAEFVVNVYIHSWLYSKRSVLEPLRRCAEALFEAGDVEYALYAQGWRAVYRALVGDPLPEVAEEFWKLTEKTTRLGVHYNIECEQALDILVRVDGDTGDAARRLLEAAKGLLRSGDTGRMTGGVCWLVALCVLGRWEEAQALDARVAPWVFEVGACTAQMPDYVFFRGLMAAQFTRKRASRRLLASSIRRLRRWSIGAPDVEHMALCLEAERLAAQGRAKAALERYQRAGDRALEQGHPHHAAIIQERRARLLMRLFRRSEADSAVRKAIALYQEWGAHRKVRMLSSELEEGLARFR